ncbi:hypothetical protein M9H77_30602 [Catharanthus roseus]|uniref:Uncharacterized protein n=1 Tax=Catharanthus roseus TaxID=4058 RepID=A0ACB9ZYS2_CATRO|nr:hypothetical protein M9H77_30602 [Catharanthus roseus]
MKGIKNGTKTESSTRKSAPTVHGKLPYRCRLDYSQGCLEFKKEDQSRKPIGGEDSRTNRFKGGTDNKDQESQEPMELKHGTLIRARITHGSKLDIKMARCWRRAYLLPKVALALMLPVGFWRETTWEKMPYHVRDGSVRAYTGRLCFSRSTVILHLLNYWLYLTFKLFKLVLGVFSILVENSLSFLMNL